MDTVAAPSAVLELIDRSGRVEQRIALHGREVRIGRAYDNDLILDDAHVSPHHALLRVGTDGRWQVFDLASVNGIRTDTARRRVSELTLEGERLFTLGLSQLRFRAADLPMPEALPLRGPRHYFPGIAFALGATVACLGAFAFDALLDSYEPFGALKLLNAVLPAFVMMLIWSGVWALIGRLLVHRLRLAAHLSVLAGGLLFATLFEAASHLGAFALSLDGALPWLEAVGLCTTCILILYGHLRLASRLRRRGALIAAAVFGMLLAGALQIKQLVYLEQFSPRPHFTLTLAPPGWRFVAPEPTAAFYAHAETLAAALAEDSPAAPPKKP